MSQAAVQMFAEIVLKTDKGLAQAKAYPAELKKALGTGGLDVPLSIKFPADLQQRLNTAVAQLKVNPITVPVHFAPGAMPGMGGAGVPVGGGAGMAIGAASPNWSMYFGQLQQQMQRAMAQVPVSAAPGGMPAAGGGPGAMGLYNPFSPRGLARAVGTGVGVYAALSAVNLATQGAEAYQTAAHPERILRGMEHVGSRFDVDATSVHASSQLASTAGQKQMIQAVESIPLAGSLVKLVDAVTGATKSLDDFDVTVKRNVELHEFARQQAVELTTKETALEGDAGKILADKQLAEHDVRVSAKDVAQRNLDIWAKGHRKIAGMDRSAADEATLGQLQRTVDEEQNTLDHGDRAAGVETGIANQNRFSTVAMSEDAARFAGMSARATGMATAGDPLGALKLRQKLAREQVESKYAATLNQQGLDPLVRQETENKKAAELAELAGTQPKELDTAAMESRHRAESFSAAGGAATLRLAGDTDAAKRFQLSERLRVEQEKLAGPGGDAKAAAAQLTAGKAETAEQERDIGITRASAEMETQQKIKDIRGKANEDYLKDSGATYTADAEAFKRMQAQKIEAATIAEFKETDAAKKAQAGRELAAVKAAAVIEQKGFDARRELQQQRENYLSGGQLRSAELFGAGQVTEAGREGERRNIAQRFTESLRSGNINAVFRSLNEGQGFGIRNEREDLLKSQNIKIRTADLAGQAAGQAGIGGVLELGQNIQAMMQDAGEDKNKQKDAKNFANAAIAQQFKALRPPAAYHDLAEFHDSIQLGISQGGAHDQAIGLLGKIGNAVNGPGGAAKALDNVLPEAMRMAAKDLKDAAGVLGKAQGVFIIQ